MIPVLQYPERAERIWCTYFKEARCFLEDRKNFIHPYYYDNFHLLKEYENHLPSIDDLNDLLSAIEWKAQYVDGYIPPWEVATLLTEQVLPISSSIRSENEIFFASEPDFIHDLIGHIPSLFAADYRSHLRSWCDIAAKISVSEVDRLYYHMNKMIIECSQKENVSASKVNVEKSIMNLMSREPTLGYIIDKLYFWFFEFGIFIENDRLKILGAGLISSINELKKICSDLTHNGELKFSDILKSINISDEQDTYYIFKKHTLNHLMSSFEKYSEFRALNHSIFDKVAEVR